MEYILKNKEPKQALIFFEDICIIPHVSGNEKGVCDYLVSFAKRRGLWCSVDDMYNTIIKKPGTVGYENLPPLILQCHTDMVGVKKEDSDHDFSVDPLRLVLEGDILRADKTSLGADDGIGVALILGLLDASDILHPPLECVFTAQEETGLHGAMALDTSALTGKQMINLDAGPEGVLIVTSAGGMKVELSKSLTPAYPSGEGFHCEIVISGLSGGHSGMQIVNEKGNAIKLMSVLLHRLGKSFSFQLESVNGGEADNVIANSCRAKIFLGADESFESLSKAVDEIKNQLALCFPNEDMLSVQLTKSAQAGKVLSTQETKEVLRLLFLLPAGVRRRSLTMENLPELSCNLGLITTDENQIKIQLSLRSDVDARKLVLYDEISELAEITGFHCRYSSEYPGWPASQGSRLLSIFTEAFEDCYKRPPAIQGIHAGLECGVFKRNIPDLEIVATGPLYGQMHTVDEWLDLPSCERTYGLLVEVLERLCKSEVNQ